MAQVDRMLTVLNVVGTRPEAVKMAPVIKELKKHPNRVNSLVCATAQHRQMLDQILNMFDIQPDYDLNIMQNNQTLSNLTASLLTELDNIVTKIKPDWILAQGDTTTVLVTALVAYYHNVRFGHVEAGLRSGDIYKPFPEEVNRKFADSTANLLFAPTDLNKKNLIAEGIFDDKIFVTGNTVIDALLTILDYPFNGSSGQFANLPHDKRIVLITAHRRESFGDPIQEICMAIRELAMEFESDGVHFVYPVHLNPNIRKPVFKILSNIPNISLIKPLDYQSFVNLMSRSILILTDSGGLQEEAPSLEVPVLVMRDVTERPEGIEAGNARLVGTRRDRITAEAKRLLRYPIEYDAMTKKVNPYGDGQAAKRIVSILLEHAT